MATVGMNADVEIGADPASRPAPSTHAVVVLGSPVTARAFSVLARELATPGRQHRLHPRRRRLPGHRPRTDGHRGRHRRRGGRRAAHRAGGGRGRSQNVDIAVERAGLARRAKRLIVFDVDSTLVQGEVIEMLAARAGDEDEVRAVTEAAMRGEIDFAESLHQRVAILAGLDASRASTRSAPHSS